MNWNQLISAKRFGMEEFHEERQENRSEFQRDYDRLIFSAPFRRLQNKTQVFPLPGSIFVHNRLTHSLEVSCVGRSLGNDVAKAILERQPELQESFLPEIGSIVSAACLAHDLGNPPFGHSGERAISTFFSEGKGQFLKDKQPDGEQLSSMEWEDLTHFEGNANAFRLLTHQFEGRRKGGFAMTYTTLASIVKYPFSSSLAGTKSKFGFFVSEEESFHRIATELGLTLLNEHPLKYARHPLVYLVEAADDICYQMMDIEDAHKLKILTTEETKELLMAYFNEERQAHIQKTFHIVNDTNEQIAYLRSSVIGLLIRECTRVFLEHEQEILSGTFEEAGSIFRCRDRLQLKPGSRLQCRSPVHGPVPDIRWESDPVLLWTLPPASPALLCCGGQHSPHGLPVSFLPPAPPQGYSTPCRQDTVPATCWIRNRILYRKTRLSLLLPYM